MLSRILTTLLLIFFVLGGYIAYTSVTLPNVRTKLASGIEPSQTSQILAQDHSVIMSYGKFQHKAIPLSDVSPKLIEALLATEDRRFYQHSGIDLIGTMRALVRDIVFRGVHEGGSTVTQQLARNIFLSNERSIQRKMKEALLAIKLEHQLTKDQILELYLNNVYFGEGAYGISAASNIYFGKSPRHLKMEECALLAGLPQAPSLYDPFTNPDLALKRRNEVLDNLVKYNKLTLDQAEQLKLHDIHLNPNGRSLSSSDKAPFFDHFVIQQVSTLLDLDEQTFWQQGLKVYTTLQPRAQRIAVQEVNTLSNAYGRRGPGQQAALLSIDGHGRMIAYVGGKNFSVSQFDRVSQARRQAGSLFKVFVYTSALEHGLTPQTVYKDAPIEFGPWKPENYDKGHHGYMTLAEALVHSNNIVAVKLLHDLSPAAAIQTARKMGITSPLDPNLSLALGAADVSLREMTGAFNVLRNDGNSIEPYAIERITDRAGRVLYEHQPDPHKVIERAPRDTMVKMLEGVIRFGTGRAADIGRPAAGKTGTSDDYRDAWFIGFTPEVTTGVWVGNDDSSKMQGITGGTIPARIWHGYMTRLLANTPKRDFDLANAQPITDKDFFVYNLSHLSRSEGALPPGSAQGDTQADTPQDAEGQTVDNAASNTPAEGNTENAPNQPVLDNNQAPVPIQTIPVPNNSPNGASAPRPVSPKAAEDRFFNFKPPTPGERFAMPSGGQEGRGSRYGANPGSGGED